jgi:hypothetical protein
MDFAEFCPLYEISNPELVAPKTVFSFLISNQEEQVVRFTVKPLAFVHKLAGGHIIAGTGQSPAPFSPIIGPRLGVV